MTPTRPTQGGENIGSDQHFYRNKVKTYLTNALRFNRSKRGACAPVTSLGRMMLRGALCLAMLSPIAAEANTISTDALKLYAHSRIISYKQFQCFNKLITQESNWRIDARNGSHYGLGQMRNKKYKTLDGYTQIDWSLRYIKKRYQSPCKAYAFLMKHGYH